MRVAKDISGKLLSIDFAVQDAKYYCVDCEQEVFSKNKKPKEIRVRDIHFAHFPESPCTGNLESYLHKISKILIAAEKRMTFPTLGLINYVNSYIESQIEDIRPDIIIEPESGRIAIEIFVRNKTEWVKIAKYRKKNITSFEIDLSNLDYNSDLEIIRKELFENLSNKKLIHLKGEPITSDIKKRSYWYEFFVGVGLFILALRVFEKPSQPKRRNR